MAEQLSFREIFAYRPLVIAWVWEMLCIAAAIYFGGLRDNIGVMFVLILVGALPFVIALMMFLQARKRGELGPKPGSIVE